MATSNYTPDDYQQDYRDALTRFQELIGDRYSTPDEAQELVELTTFLADHSAFGLDEWGEA